MFTFTIAFTLGLAAVANAVSGVFTFNDYTGQTGVVCPGFHPTNDQGANTYAAALADLSPLWTGNKCQGSINGANCNGSGNCKNCAGPACPDEQFHDCGKCYNISCVSSISNESSGKCSGKTVKVKIVDACPATHPANYCKIPQFGGKIPPNQACQAAGVNAFDIASTARSVLSSFKGNLNINIEAVAC